MRLRFILASVFVLICAFFIIPKTFVQKDNDQKIQPFGESFEMTAKHELIQQDVMRTDQLCRKQCALQFQRTLIHLKENETKENAAVKQKLMNMMQQYPHMIYVAFDYEGKKQQFGQLEDSIRKQALPFLNKAKASLKTNRTYESPRFQAGEHDYFVLAQKVHASAGEMQLFGVVEHRLLNEIKTQQKRNFRIVPYPNENRKRMQTMDAKTKQSVQPGSGPEQEGTSHYHVDEVVVKFRSEPTSAQLEQIRKDIHASAPEKQVKQTYVFRSKEWSAEEMIQYFSAWDIVYAEPHFLYLTNEIRREEIAPPSTDSETIVPNDELFRQYQWNLPFIDTLEGWNLSRGSEDVTVAVIDTGVDVNHTDLQGQLYPGFNMIDETQLPHDDVGHGTHVAGVVAALVNNNEGVAGMSWYNKVLPIKVLDQTGAGTTYSVARGIIWAVDQGAKVINLSLGNYADAEFLHDAIRYAYEQDVVIIAAAGNDNTSQPGYPAAYPEVLAVSALDWQQDKASFSNYGDYIDVAAPGVNIASTYTDNRYASLSGTSMASPHVAALAAMMRSLNPTLTNQEVMDIIRNTAIDLGPKGKDPYFGHGQVDVSEALLHAAGGKTAQVETNANQLDWQQRLSHLFRSWLGQE